MLNSGLHSCALSMYTHTHTTGPVDLPLSDMWGCFEVLIEEKLSALPPHSSPITWGVGDGRKKMLIATLRFLEEVIVSFYKIPNYVYALVTEDRWEWLQHCPNVNIRSLWCGCHFEIPELGGTRGVSVEKKTEAQQSHDQMRIELCLVVPTSNPSTWEVRARGSDVQN